MSDSIMLGLGRLMIPLPGALWRRAIAAAAAKARASLNFMSADHRRVREFVVLELPRAQRPLSAEHIATALGMDVARVVSLCDDLERRLTFLFRNDRGEVSWAYPVTVDKTPHHAIFSTGEQAYSP